MNAKEYHCEFCSSTGEQLRNEEKGCCNNCGAPIGITDEQANKVYDNYFRGYVYIGTSDVRIIET